MASVTTVTWTGNQDIDGLLTGYKWAQTSLTYSFPADGSFYGSHYATTNTQNTTGFAQLNAAQQGAARSVLAQYQAVSGLTFTEMEETATQHATLRQAQSGVSRTADSYNPNPSFADAESGDSWFSSYRTWYLDPVKGSYGYLTFLHEIGLALGLRDNTTGTLLTYAHDSMEYSVETYRSYVGAAVNGYQNEAWSYAQSIMIADIAAIQQMYGANYNTNSSNTVYSWSATTGEQFINGAGQGAPGGNKIFQTIWDGNGVDTYDFSNYATNLSVDLRAGGWTTVSTAQLADLGGVTAPGAHIAAGNIANAWLYDNDARSLIENAAGGSGNDSIVGNQANNVLTGGAGTDVLYGLAGNDTVDGGLGSDTAVFTGARSNYRVSRGENGSLYITDLRAGSPDGSDVLVSVENLQFSDGVFSPSALGIAAPIANATTVTLVHGQAVPASWMFSTSTPYIQQYRFFEAAVPGGGAFVLSGVAQAANANITVDAGDLANLTYQSGNASDQLWVQVFDGVQWSGWTQLSVNLINHAPAVTSSDVVANKGQSFAVSSLFGVSDADVNDSVVKYQFWDSTTGPSSGSFMINGVSQDAGRAIDVSAAQLAGTVFQSRSGMDQLWVRVSDGLDWSAWQQFNVTAPVDRAANVTVENIGVAMNYTLGANQLFSSSDPDGDTVTQYEFWDSSADATSGHFNVGGVAQAAGQAIGVTASSINNVTFTSPSAPGTDQLWVRAFDGVLWSEWKSFAVTAPVVLAPKVVVADTTIAKNGSILAADLFHASVPYSSETVTAYQLWDDASGANSGYFVVNGVAQTAGQAIDVSASNLAHTYFQANEASSDSLWVRAATGNTWSNWVHFTVYAPDAAPVVTAADLIATKGETFQAADLFDAVDSDAGDTISQYQFWDSTANGDSGYFAINDVRQGSNQSITVNASDLANTVFQSGSGTDQLWVRAFDGQIWSDWKGFNVVAPINHAPVSVASNQIVAKNATVAASSLFTVVDQDSDTIAGYQFWDSTAGANSGHFSINGVQQAANVAIDVAGSQLSQVSFSAKAGSVDDLWVRAFDGVSWSNWQPFSVSAPNHAPIATVGNLTASKGQEFSASQLFSVSDADAGDTVVKYQLWDSTVDSHSGSFVVDGVTQGAGLAIDVSAAQLAGTTFQSGSGADQLWVRAFDGQDWGDWKGFTVAAPIDHAPVVTAGNVALSAGQTVTASSLFSVSDVDLSDQVVKYQFWDGTAGSSTGHFAVNGAEQATGSAITVLAADLAHASFVAGTGANDQLWVRASDGAVWSDWTEFHVTSSAHA
ncbi:M10 family metallopeptidase [Bradyrhizobium sp. LjRoot220]|uniref:M10 family metallopeptidase C-terminal domain-containing protein n=1 Tax=Bradyrhizobium sp. LjRoot220 TaxID=3342284 RepID=UPI003ED0A928